MIIWKSLRYFLHWNMCCHLGIMISAFCLFSIDPSPATLVDRPIELFFRESNSLLFRCVLLTTDGFGVFVKLNVWYAFAFCRLSAYNTFTSQFDVTVTARMRHMRHIKSINELRVFSEIFRIKFSSQSQWNVWFWTIEAFVRILFEPVWSTEGY